MSIEREAGFEMAKSERKEAILRMLEVEEALSIQELARRLEVSQMTVRRDLAVLAGEDRVRVLYGSAMLQAGRGGDSRYSLLAAGAERTEEKRRIGLLAASLVEEDDSLIIDCGSTTEYLAKHLPEDRGYTALSFSLNVVSECVRRPNCQTVFSGGLFHEGTLSFEGPEGLEAIRHFRATKAFISAAGVDPRFGVTCSNAYERETKKAVIASSMRKILVVDSSKFGQVRPVWFAELADFDEVVTDAGIPEEYAEALGRLGIALRVARG